MKTTKPLTLFMLTAKDRQEPPFHFHGVPHMLIVAAMDEPSARMYAATAAGGEAWADPALADCAELEPKAGGLIARAVD